MNKQKQKPSDHTLGELFSELRFGRTATQKKFLIALAKEWRGKHKRPVCPICAEPAVRTRIETFRGLSLDVWICSCY